MGTATFVRDITDWAGDARVYQVDPPAEYGEEYGEENYEPGSFTEYVIVSAIATAFDTGRPETYIFPASEAGRVLDWAELPGSFQGDMDHEKALLNAGYEVVA